MTGKIIFAEVQAFPKVRQFSFDFFNESNQYFCRLKHSNWLDWIQRVWKVGQKNKNVLFFCAEETQRIVSFKLGVPKCL